MYAQAAAAASMTQQQLAKQQGQHYNQNNASSGMVSNEEYYGRAASSSATKDAQYMYRVPSGQPQQVQSSSAGQQPQGFNKQQTRATNKASNVHFNKPTQSIEQRLNSVDFLFAFLTFASITTNVRECVSNL
jgi:hypothetical protein